jgi:hypothetical protein
MFNPKDWYWSVAGDAANVYSSARNIYVPTSDSDYATWQTNTGITTAPAVTSEADIWPYFQDFMPLYLWDSVGKTMSQPAVGAYTKQQLQNYNSNSRITNVGKGMTAAGVPVRTDDISRGLITDARFAAQQDPNWTTKWYGSDGNFYPVDAPTMINIAKLVSDHTNSCYLVFQQTADAITTDAVTDISQIDAAYSGL